ncbi:MAG: rRNA maturation RNase YbeY [Thermobacillus sp. ZCTH02-B1]|uniref:rRNA maturation RNase YbeY n=1 Tax=Thermobacillus sp. ZCTH02-B1 TaxID=1858795 RepID=UPI000B5541E4|nr:rRNA maturation RNase YbeY [Thermobacillus sp. ZCTH02-B1]OUM95970.1 MAG: rRNA maturation RNase YbeY [Thermobacillus sp. ZCTH02-B1]
MGLVLEWSNEQDAVRLEEGWIARLEELLRLAGEEEGIERGEVALTFVDDERIRELNREYRGIDRPTDVLSFALNEDGGEPDIVFGDLSDDEDDPISGMLGDIVISLERAKAQSEAYGHSLEREIGFLFVHGFLHLLGYDHQTEEEERIMFAKQEEILRRAGLTR